MNTGDAAATTNTANQKTPGYILLLSELKTEELQTWEKQDQGHLLQVDANRVFDLCKWVDSDDCKNNRYPMRDEEQFQTLLNDMAEAGMMVRPVIDNVSGRVVDGRHRLLALHRHRSDGIIYPFPGFEIRHFVDQIEIDDFQDRFALQTRRLNRTQMGKLIQEAILRHPDWADNRLANLLNCDGDTIDRHAEKLIAQEKLDRPSTGIGADGRTRSRTKKNKAVEFSQPVTKLIESWLQIYGTYPVNSGNIAALMATLGYRLHADKEINSENCNRMTKEVAKHLNQLARQNTRHGAYQIYVREFRQGQTAFGLVSTKLRKPELENSYATIDNEADAALQ